jgi:hypothetical protein
MSEADDTVKNGVAVGEAEGGSLEVKDDQRKMGR